MAIERNESVLFENRRITLTPETVTTVHGDRVGLRDLSGWRTEYGDQGDEWVTRPVVLVACLGALALIVRATWGRPALMIPLVLLVPLPAAFLVFEAVTRLFTIEVRHRRFELWAKNHRGEDVLVYADKRQNSYAMVEGRVLQAHREVMKRVPRPDSGGHVRERP